jgi:hypothetical protein
VRRLLALLALGLFASLSHAQVSVENLPSGGPITGPNYSICDQSGVTNKCTFFQELAYFQAALNLTQIPTYIINDCLSNNGTVLLWATCGSGGGGGGIANFNFSTGFSSWMNVTGTPCTTTGCTVGITPATGLAQGLFLATSCAGTGAVSLRAICAADIPNNNANTTGNSATATLAAQSTALAGGAANEIAFQSTAGTTVFMIAPTVAGTSPQWNGTTFVWASAAGTVNACGNSNYLAAYLSVGSVVSCVPLGNALSLNGGVLNVAQFVNPQSGSSYAIASTDNSKLVTRSNAANMTDTIVAATTTGYTSGFAFDYTCYGPGTCTLTPTTSTVGGQSALLLGPNTFCSITSDGTNYQVGPCQPIFLNNAGGSGTSITPSCAINNEDNYGNFTATAGTFTVNAPTGCVPYEGQRLTMHFKFTNSQTYSWNTAFVGGATALPTVSTGSSKGDWLGFIYDSINSKWDFVAAATGF